MGSISAAAGCAFRSPAAAEILCAIAISRARIALKPAEQQACPARVALAASAAAAGLCARSCPRRRLAQFTGARHVCSHRERARKRYADDPEYRRRRIASARAYQKSHKEEIGERRRYRRRTDPAFRQRLLASAHAYWESHKEEIRERRRRKRLADPAPRKKRAPPDPADQRRRRLKLLYGISPEEYDAMLAHQGGVCAICKRAPQDGKMLCVDHCHLTGVVRGLLCSNCNSALAFFREEPDALRAAIAYLRRAAPRGAANRRASGRAMRPPDIIAADAKPYHSGVT